MNEPVLRMLASQPVNSDVLCAWVTVNKTGGAEWLARETFDAVALDVSARGDQFRRLDTHDPQPRPCRPASLSGLDAPAYFKAANATTQAIEMIESRAALDALDDILRVEGVDACSSDYPTILSRRAAGAASGPAARRS
jgi:2-keto-3-deoxy-L-rhamnonate aldolase RhmA